MLMPLLQMLVQKWKVFHKAHFRTEHDELNRFETIDGGYQCHYCPKRFATRAGARKHVEDHHHPVDIVYNGNLREIDTYFIRRNLHWQCRDCGTIVPNATKQRYISTTGNAGIVER
jgi:hypothetical protein